MSTRYICTEGCMVREEDRTVAGARRVQETELLAHDDRHVSDGARPLVRMLRDVSPEVREEVLAYFTGPLPRFAAAEDA